MGGCIGERLELRIITGQLFGVLLLFLFRSLLLCDIAVVGDDSTDVLIINEVSERTFHPAPLPVLCKQPRTQVHWMAWINARFLEGVLNRFEVVRVNEFVNVASYQLVRLVADHSRGGGAGIGDVGVRIEE